MDSANYLRDTIDLVKQIETRFLELGARLYQIRKHKFWGSTYESYEEFLDASKISPGNASMLAAIHEHYVIKGGVSHEKLSSVGYSNLYFAIPLIEKDGVEKAVEKARLLTRSELRDEVREEKHGPHTHDLGDRRWASCNTCGKLIEIEV